MSKKTHRKKQVDKTQWEQYDYHLPVLLEESINYLITDKSGTYIDGTLGGGGHAQKIMQQLNSGGNLFAFDKDIDAINRAKSLFEEEKHKPSPRFVPFNTSFSEAAAICRARKISPMGILLDLGVSSQQLDTNQRGISYRVNSPLDMRFDSKGATAAEIINSYTEEALANIFYKYGEEPRSRKIARKIIENRQFNKINSTFELRKIVEENTPKELHFKTLSRIFQAIRIEVNQEIFELTKTLNEIIDVLGTKGRIVVISYHSLEDRVVKQIFKENSQKNKINKYSTCKANNVPILEILTPKPIIPSETEILRNPRARSAKMRVAEKK